MFSLQIQDPSKPIRQAKGLEAVRQGERSLLMAFGESGGLVLGAPAVAIVVGLAMVAASSGARGTLLTTWLWVAYAATSCLLAIAPRHLWSPALMLNGLMLQACLIGAAWMQGWGLNGATLLLLPPSMLALALLLPQLQTGITWAVGVAGLTLVWLWHESIVVEAGPLLLTQAPIGSHAVLIVGAHTAAMIVGLVLGDQLRRRMQMESEHKTRYQDFFQQVPIGVVAHRDGKIIDANQSAASLLGFGSGRELNDQSLMAVAADDATKEILLSRVERLKALQAGIQLEPASVKLQSQGGRTLQCRIVCSRVELADGPANIAMFTDESARMAMEDSLRWSLSVQERLVASSPLAIGITQVSDGRTISSNQAAAELTGYSIDELVEMSSEQRRQLWPMQEQLKQVRQDLATVGIAAARDLSLRTRNGEIRRVSVWASWFSVNEEGYIVWFGQDITEQEAQRVAREAMMDRARAEAEAASRAKTAFLANTSHELRTPLNAIIGLSQLAVAPSVTDAQRLAYLHQIRESSQGLLHLVSEVLDIAKIEAGALELEMVTFDLRGVLAEIASTYATLARDKGLGFEVNLPWSDAHRVTGDPVRLRQVVLNLLSNALKFTDRGSVRMSVRRLSHTHVCIEVQDTGPGVDENLQELIFQPFAQADSSTTRRHGGTGLGLSIVRELCVRMGGHCDVSSVPGQGSRFWCLLELPSAAPQGANPLDFLRQPAAPLQNLAEQSSALQAPEDCAPAETVAVVAAVDVEAARQAQIAETDPPRCLAGRRVLVVEDNPVNRMIVTLMLEQRGAQVITAHDGRQAIGMLEQLATMNHLPDAVLMDMQMPEMDGKTATRTIRANPKLAALPVIALTAGVTVEEREAALASGVDAYLTKPVDIEQLMENLLSRFESRAVEFEGPTDQERLATSVKMS